MQSPREARSPPRSRRRVPGKPQSVHGEFSAPGRTPPGQAWAGGAPSVLGSQVGVAEGVQKGRAGPFSLAGGAPRFHRGTPAGTALGGRGRPPAVRYWPSRLLGGLDCGRGPSSGEGQWGLGASRPAGGREGGASPEPRPRGGLCADRPALLPCHARRRRDLVKGLALSSFARLLRRSPCTPKLSQARLLQAPSVRVRDTGGPGSWRSVPVPSLPARPFVHRGRATHSQPSAWGRASAFLSLLSAAEPGREGTGTGPAISQAGPRGMCPFSCGEQVAPGSGPFCSLYFILKLYLMLLYERGRGGKRAVRHPYVQMSYLLCVYQR